ncbi:MAG: bifunctional (p)ppGpp synthetase/guanosine-3',5'-bis(diphosphate) 3'-pyrophosphohydrolase [Deltaproteobacteria bacterium]|nr:bifunctional (p)ppGpp synthetase/guanosine-3',5'-bis(diphosphate) 3'-pyrophosphohydrolase [Deltaproteobacteria bacterium]
MTDHNIPENQNVDLEQELSDIIENIIKYHKEAPVSLIRKAFDFSKNAHQGQLRSSGDEYLTHPLMVAKILCDMRMDVATIVTGLLHDTVEDTHVTLKTIEDNFGKDTAHLVDGVTKLSKLQFRTTEEKQAENFRKMFIAMAQDIRVILVKLADRLHNMRTLHFIADQRQQRIAQETLDIYAPLANRLGISWLKIELEDLSFRYLKPEIYYKLVEKVSQKKQERQAYITDVMEEINKTLKKYDIKASVKGRPKHFYSIYKKMETQNLDFDQIYDIIGFRINVEKISECYEVLGIIHSIWKPVPGRFKDYIAMPKANSYQSLHTTVVGPRGERVEIQIRTHEMDLVAERGIAAHWQYKDGHVEVTNIKKFTWLAQLVEYQKELKDPSEFLETVKVDLFPGDIYVFTPRGKVLELPVGSTPLDFAYEIHTEIGHHCVGAKINGRVMPLKTKLKSGDMVEVMTDPARNPSKDWLHFIVTSRAKSKIRKYIKDEQRQRGLELGKELCEKIFRRYQLNFRDIHAKGELDRVASKMNYKTTEDLILAVGYGRVGADHLVKKYLPPESLSQVEKEKELLPVKKNLAESKKEEGLKGSIRVRGMDDILVRFAQCCNPLMGDAITGFVTRGRGVTIHRSQCSKMLASDPQRKIDVGWDQTAQVERKIKIRVVCQDVKGLLMEMSQVFSNSGVNIVNASIRTTRDKKAINIFTVSVTSTEKLRQVMRNMEALDGVISVERM